MNASSSSAKATTRNVRSSPCIFFSIRMSAHPIPMCNFFKSCQPQVQERLDENKQLLSEWSKVLSSAVPGARNIEELQQRSVEIHTALHKNLAWLARTADRQMEQDKRLGVGGDAGQIRIK